MFKISYYTVLVFATCVCAIGYVAATSSSESNHQPNWIANIPERFRRTLNKIHSIQNNHEELQKFTRVVDSAFLKQRGDCHTDGEVIDALDHYFWGMKNGSCIELGALDGTKDTHSMTKLYEEQFYWTRILIEANPDFKDKLSQLSPLAFAVSAAICSKTQVVHYGKRAYVSGILEFMNNQFLKEFYNNIYNMCTPPGNVSSLDYSAISANESISEVQCIPLSKALHYIGAKHINFFLLDVEGGELSVLKTVRWDQVKFDVLCIETQRDMRPPGYEEEITSFLQRKGYVKNANFGRNTWFIRNDFVPSVRPGLQSNCFRGSKACSLTGKQAEITNVCGINAEVTV